MEYFLRGESLSIGVQLLSERNAIPAVLLLESPRFILLACNLAMKDKPWRRGLGCCRPEAPGDVYGRLGCVALAPRFQRAE